ncbi:MAG: LysR family transcriptional regulator [Veillonella sp.]|nr:LysR family transcriptional regulator [Veillonella sp.]
MDTSYYHNFITLIQAGNMTQAAEILHITQPALSKQLKYLEAEFGTPLLKIKRGQRGAKLELTEAGRIFYDKALQLCAIDESIHNEVKALNSKIEGTLRIAASASRSTAFLQRHLPEFAKKYPSVHYSLFEGVMTEITGRLITGEAELGIANEYMVDHDKFDVILTQEEFLYAVFRKDVFFTDKAHEDIVWQDIAKAPLALSGGSFRMITQSGDINMKDLNVSITSTSKSSAIEWAATGRSIALVPMEEKETINQRQMMRIKVPHFSHTFKKAFIMLKGHSLSPVAQQFIDFYRGTI